MHYSKITFFVLFVFCFISAHGMDNGHSSQLIVRTDALRGAKRKSNLKISKRSQKIKKIPESKIIIRSRFSSSWFNNKSVHQYGIKLAKILGIAPKELKYRESKGNWITYAQLNNHTINHSGVLYKNDFVEKTDRSPTHIYDLEEAENRVLARQPFYNRWGGTFFIGCIAAGVYIGYEKFFQN